MTRLKFAIVGAGTWGETHAHIYNDHPNVDLVAICDRNPARAREVAGKFNLPDSRAFADHREMLEKTEIDAVSIVTPDFSHREIAVDCANAKKNILIEKPLATTLDDAEAIIEAVKKNNVRVMVDLHNRWSPPFAVTKEAIEKGEIGEPYTAYFRLNDIKWVATTLLPWAAKSSILWFLGSHSVDTLRWIFNDEVKRVFSVSREGILKREGIDTADIYQTILEFKNGGIATMENGWVTPDSSPWVNDLKFNILGTKGMISLDLSNSQMIERFTEDKSDRPDIIVKNFVHGVPKGFSFESIRHFVDCLVTGKDFYVSLEDAINSVKVILAILESAGKREPVEVKY
jgi:predicted dehydrogenase